MTRIRIDHYRLAQKQLRWTCDPKELPFESSDDVKAVTEVIGQDSAIEALRFGLETNAPGQNIFVRGLTGTGRLSSIKQLLAEISPTCPLADDRCYVRNFEQADRPRLLTLPRGKGKSFVAAIDDLIDYIKEDLGPALKSDSVRHRKTKLDHQLGEDILAITKPFEAELKSKDLAMVTIQLGGAPHPAIFPTVDKKPVPPERFEELKSKGKIQQKEAEKIEKALVDYSERFETISVQVQELSRKHRAKIKQLYQKEVRNILGRFVKAIEKEFPFERVKEFLEAVIEDVANRNPESLQTNQDFTRLYRANLLVAPENDSYPIVIENNPTVRNLLGTIDRESIKGEVFYSDHLMIHAGSLLRADGGYLIIECQDILTEPGAWKVLMRTIRSRRLEIAPDESIFPWLNPLLKPESIEINLKVILLGDADLFVLLDMYDKDFPHLFKVLADFDNSIPRTLKAIQFYAGVLAKIKKEENLLPFDRTAIAVLAEHGARISAQQNRLTTQFGRLADIAREAAFIANKKHQQKVMNEHVRTAVSRGKKRADLPARRYREYISTGKIRIQTHGKIVGQVNGLAVIQAGSLIYGFPTRITATIGPGTAGTVSIEREAELSGAIHTKGFYILSGLMRHLLKTEHPLAFNASIAFEQSYGGIDGDSASGAEICCLLSALTEFPLRQDIAVTGAVDQLGHIQPVGAVTEKIEGFYDVCATPALSGTQGVIIPKPNMNDLMLREDIVQASRDHQFHVYAVETIHEALEILTGHPSGKLGRGNKYPEGSVLARAGQKAFEYWEKVSQNNNQ